jgi:hypothetical protein
MNRILRGLSPLKFALLLLGLSTITVLAAGPALPDAATTGQDTASGAPAVERPDAASTGQERAGEARAGADRDGEAEDAAGSGPETTGFAPEAIQERLADNKARLWERRTELLTQLEEGNAADAAIEAHEAFLAREHGLDRAMEAVGSAGPDAAAAHRAAAPGSGTAHVSSGP